jgi:hypothetical protein
MSAKAGDILKAAGINVRQNPSKDTTILFMGPKGKKPLDKSAAKPKQ